MLCRLPKARELIIQNAHSCDSFDFQLLDANETDGLIAVNVI